MLADVQVNKKDKKRYRIDLFNSYTIISVFSHLQI